MLEAASVLLLRSAAQWVRLDVVEQRLSNVRIPLPADGPLPVRAMHGKNGAKSFYDELTQAIKTEEMEPVRRYYGPDFAVIKHIWRGTVPGSFLGVPGHTKRVAFRMLHVWEFRDGRMSRENVWLDGGAVVAQLSSV